MVSMIQRLLYVAVMLVVIIMLWVYGSLYAFSSGYNVNTAILNYRCANVRVSLDTSGNVDNFIKNADTETWRGLSDVDKYCLVTDYFHNQLGPVVSKMMIEEDYTVNMDSMKAKTLNKMAVKYPTNYSLIFSGIFTVIWLIIAYFLTKLLNKKVKLVIFGDSNYKMGGKK